MLNQYAVTIHDSLLNCEVVQGLENLRRQYLNVRWHVVSGGDQQELRNLFAHRGLHHFFDGSIFGSPDDKKLILQREIQAKNILFPAVFFGDSRYDYISANTFGIDFVFVSKWTEVSDWRSFISENNLVEISSVDSL